MDQRQEAHPPLTADCAEEFFARGWLGRYGRHPWVVLERVACTARRFEQALREARARDGWAFGVCSYRILDAPTFDIYADTATRLRIVEAICEFPARRAARPNQPLMEESFKWPVLLVAAAPDTGKLTLLGRAGTGTTSAAARPRWTLCCTR